MIRSPCRLHLRIISVQLNNSTSNNGGDVRDLIKDDERVTVDVIAAPLQKKTSFDLLKKQLCGGFSFQIVSYKESEAENVELIEIIFRIRQLLKKDRIIGRATIRVNDFLQSPLINESDVDPNFNVNINTSENNLPTRSVSNSVVIIDSGISNRSTSDNNLNCNKAQASDQCSVERDGNSVLVFKDIKILKENLEDEKRKMKNKRSYENLAGQNNIQLVEEEEVGTISIQFHINADKSLPFKLGGTSRSGQLKKARSGMITEMQKSFIRNSSIDRFDMAAMKS